MSNPLCLSLAVLALPAVATVSLAAQGVEAKTHSRFELLDPGAIHPQGWVKQYASTIADGWLLLYAKERVPVIYDQFWARNGMTGDYASYFADGLIRLSEIAPESTLAKEELRPWLTRALASQEPDGYLGAYPPGKRWGNGEPGDQWLEVFSQSVMIQALLYRYRCTGDTSILDACKRSAAKIMAAYASPESEVKHSIFGSHGAIVIRAMRDLYLLTGDGRYADFAKEVLSKHGKVDSYLRWYDDHNYECVSGQHGVIEEEHMSFPVTVYEMTGDEKLKIASEAGWEMMSRFVTMSGQPTASEAIVKPLSRALSEHCAAVDWIISNNEMARIIGDVKYADAAERAMFNAYPGAKSPDTMTLSYMHSVNELAAAEWSHPRDFEWEHWISRTYYSTAHCPMCCCVNSPRGIAHFIDNMVYRSRDGGLAVVHYGPARIEASMADGARVALTMETEYPFEDTVRIHVDPSADSTFPLALRIPGWCSSAKIELNGVPADVAVKPGEFATVTRAWKKGDTVTLSMDVPIRMIDYPAGDLYAPGAAVQRGPLTFTMPVDEDWQRFDARWTHGPVRDKEHISYRVLPKKGSAWNYALIVDKANIGKSFTVKRLPAGPADTLWKDPRIVLEVKARKVLNWEAEGTKTRPETPGLPYTPMELSKRVSTIRLIPFGCSRLRMTYLPIIDK